MKNAISKQYIRPSKSTQPLPLKSSILTAEELKAVTDYVQNEANNHPNRKTKTTELMVLILARGLRPAELLNLNIGDLPRFHGRSVIIVCNRALTREVYLNDSLERKINEYVQNYRQDAEPEEPLFISREGNRSSMNTLYAKISRNMYWRTNARRGTYRGLAEILQIKHLMPPVFRRTAKYQLVGKVSTDSKTEKERLRTKATGVTLEDFMREYCYGNPSRVLLKSLKRSLYNANDRGRITLPNYIGHWTSGGDKKFAPFTLIKFWAEYRYVLPSLPTLDSHRANIALKAYQAS